MMKSVLTQVTVSGCKGTQPCGPMWCANPNKALYICRSVSCSPTGYSSNADCVCNYTAGDGDACAIEPC